MRSVWEGGRRAAGALGVAGLAFVGFVSALMLAGGALGQLPVPTVTTPSVPGVTVTTPSLPVVPTTTVTTPPVPTTTVAPPKVGPPPPPPPPPPRANPPAPPPPRATPPAPPPPVSPPPPPVSPPRILPISPPSLPKLPGLPKISTPPPPSPAISPPSPPVGAPSAPALSPSGSGSGLPLSPSGQRSAATARTNAAAGSPAQGPARTSTAAAAAGAALGTSAGYGPRQEPPYLVGLPSSGSAALGYGAFIVPTGAGKGGVRLVAPTGRLRGAVEPDLFALLGLPDFLRDGRAAAARRAGNPLPDVEAVLGRQATLTNVGDGGGLRFGQLPLLALALVLFSTILLVGAVVPPGLVARTPLTPADYARFREPMALAAIGILVPVAVVALVVALS